MFPARSIDYEGRLCKFTDGGLSDALPIGFARDPILGATHVIASDCRSRPGAHEIHDAADLVYVRPQLEDTRVLRAPRASLLKAVAAGEAAVTPDMRAVNQWLELAIVALTGTHEIQSHRTYTENYRLEVRLLVYARSFMLAMIPQIVSMHTEETDTSG